MEIWKSLKGIQDNGDFYEVSNLGNVRSIDKIINQINGNSYLLKGKILKQHKNRNGYMTVCLSLNYKEKRCEIQRLVAKAFLPNIDGKPIVNHKDSDPTNNCSNNLEWCTQSENVIHAQINGMKGIGVNHYESRLTEDSVKEIRRLYSEKILNLRQLGKIYNMSESGIWGIVNRKTYKSIL